MAKVLSLQTAIDQKTRQHIEIDGKSYLMHHQDDLSLVQRGMLLKAAKDIQAMGEKALKGDINKNTLEKIEQQLNEAVAAIVQGISPEVLKKLSDGQKLEIINAFGQAETKRRQGTPNKVETTKETSTPAS